MIYSLKMCHISLLIIAEVSINNLLKRYFVGGRWSRLLRLLLLLLILLNWCQPFYWMHIVPGLLSSNDAIFIEYNSGVV